MGPVNTSHSSVVHRYSRWHLCLWIWPAQDSQSWKAHTIVAKPTPHQWGTCGYERNGDGWTLKECFKSIKRDLGMESSRPAWLPSWSHPQPFTIPWHGQPHENHYLGWPNSPEQSCWSLPQSIPAVKNRNLEIINRQMGIIVDTSSTRTRRGGSCLKDIYKTFLIYRTCMRRAPAKPVRACTLRKWCLVSHVTFEAPLRTSHFSLQSSHSTLHTSHSTLHTALFTLHPSQSTLNFTLYS